MEKLDINSKALFRGTVLSQINLILASQFFFHVCFFLNLSEKILKPELLTVQFLIQVFTLLLLFFFFLKMRQSQTFL